MDRYDPAPAASAPEQDKKPAKATTKAGNRVATSKAQGKARATSAESKQERALTPKQEAFCLAYLETGNASEAYRKTAGLIGKDKDAARTRAIQLYPDLRVLDLKGKGQAVADALLIARHGASL